MEKRKLRVFEAFAGIGAQATALERIGIDYEVVGMCLWQAVFGKTENDNTVFGFARVGGITVKIA